MKKRSILVLLLVMLSLFVVACGGKKEDTEETKAGTSTTDSAKKEDAKDEVVTLKWVTVGSGMPKNYDAWKENINKYLEEKIGVNIDVEVVPWGDWSNRRNVLVNSGEEFDILFTDLGRYRSEANMGALMDISELVKTATPDLYEYIPEDYWEAVKVGGKIYSVPTYKDSSMTQYLIWDKAIIDKYNVDYKNLTSFESLTETLRKIKEGEGVAPFYLDQNGSRYVFAYYDNMGLGLNALGVRFDDETRTVVNALQQEDVLKTLDILHGWYKEGIINPDAPTMKEEVSTYKTLFTSTGWSSAAKTTWGPNMGIEAEAVQLTETLLSNTTVRGSLNGISSGTKYPEKCLEFLQLINLDPKVRDAFYYGLEGENFEYTAEGKVKKLNSDWSMAGYTQGTFFNVSGLDGEEVNQWDEVKTLNEQAKPSVLLGFDVDTTNIENELVNCREVYKKYSSELLTGAREPREFVKQITTELEAAGFNKILEEVQNQVNAYYK